MPTTSRISPEPAAEQDVLGLHAVVLGDLADDVAVGIAVAVRVLPRASSSPSSRTQAVPSRFSLLASFAIGRTPVTLVRCAAVRNGRFAADRGCAD